MIEPKEFIVQDQKGNSLNFTLTKFNCVAGREIISKYPISNLPKLGEYSISEEVMLKLMSFVYVNINKDGGEPKYLPLNNVTLLQNHVPDWEVLMQIEKEMLSYNCSFFQNGKSLTSLAELFQTIAVWSGKTLTAFLEQLSQQTKPPSTN
jgi:hypothetical protein